MRQYVKRQGAAAFAGRPPCGHEDHIAKKCELNKQKGQSVKTGLLFWLPEQDSNLRQSD